MNMIPSETNEVTSKSFIEKRILLIILFFSTATTTQRSFSLSEKLYGKAL